FTFIAVARPMLALLRLPKTSRGWPAHYARRGGSSGCRGRATSSRTAAAALPSMPRSLRSTPKATSFSRVRPSCLVSLLLALLAKGHPMSDDPLDTYFFQCSGSDLFAVSHDMTGANLPRASCAQGWILRGTCRLGEHASVPTHVDYYIWRDPCWTQRKSPSNSLNV